MAKMKLCKRCANPSTRPNVYIDDEGVCGVCRLMEQNQSGNIDWQARQHEINEIAQWGIDNTRNSYDCIVTVSGGKDSMRQAFFARDELGLNPLLVSAVYPPEELHDRGAENLANLIDHGFDCISISLNPQIFKKLMQLCFQRYSNIFNASEMALYAIPIHTAIAYHIPLVFLGENPAHTIGEKHGKLDGDASQMRNSNTLLGGKADIFLDAGFSPQDLHFYNYPPHEDVEFANLRLVYLGYYIQDWSGWNNAEFSIDRGLRVRNDPPEFTGDLWGFTGLDEDFRLVNQQIKYAKFGFGHVTDQVMEKIHDGSLSREEGLELVRKYDGKCHPKFVKKLCDYLDLPEAEFWRVVNAARDRDIWKQNENGEWELIVEY